MEPSTLIASIVVSVLLMQAAPPAGRPPATASPRPPGAAEPPEEYRIGPEDVLGIFVWQNGELSRTVPVRPDGRISLPLVNDVLAAGLTPMQVRQAVLERYREFDKAIELSVIVQEINSFKVTILGKVNKPGRYRFRAPTTILELLGEAGGLAEYADGENIVVLRPELQPRGRTTSKAFTRLRFSYKRVTQTGGESQNISLQPDDIVVVP